MKKYFKHKLENLLVIDKIVTIHYFEFDKNFKSKVEAHDFWELVYADKEDILCTADGETLVLKQGELLFHKPDEVHSLAANGKNAPNVFIVSFECKSEAVQFSGIKKYASKRRTSNLFIPLSKRRKGLLISPIPTPN